MRRPLDIRRYGCTTFGSRLLAGDGEWHGRLQQRAIQPYPEPLRQAIIPRNHPILRSNRTSLLHQLEGALARGDLPAVLDRTVKLFASYFDLLFAANRVAHAGNKRLVQWVERTCRHAPADFPAKVAGVFGALAQEATDGNREVLPRVAALIADLDEVVAATN